MLTGYDLHLNGWSNLKEVAHTPLLLPSGGWDTDM